jgi:hypothetical protein
VNARPHRKHLQGFARRDRARALPCCPVFTLRTALIRLAGTLVELEEDGILEKNEWGCRYLALCPTMKVPQKVVWDREVVYECVWALLAVVDKHNLKVREKRGDDRGEKEITSFLMTPLATGYGDWSPERWAAQTVLAIKHFVEAVENKDKWKVLGTFRALTHCEEVKRTYGL